MQKTLPDRHIEIAWPDLGITVTAELDGRNLADSLCGPLPCQSLQGHALIAGELLHRHAGLLEAWRAIWDAVQRGVGAPPTISATPTVVNAICSATGLSLTHTPVSPERIYRV
ncbi:hypothetical protein ACQUSR_28265 [Streptomyces sp. P1-3]|uniref:hypothetical protein n=1 Tax=Streptomyces sp. P1-3 TaxID=3421658 RepID=UPI003D36D64E